VLAGIGTLAPEGVATTSTTGVGAFSGGALLHATKIPTIRQLPLHRRLRMTLLLLEALGAGVLFVGIIWWTMFSGRKNGELPSEDKEDKNSH